MMNVVVKHVIEIAAGLVVGSLASDALNKVVKVANDKVKKVKKG
jgi:hypothetical protein